MKSSVLSSGRGVNRVLNRSFMVPRVSFSTNDNKNRSTKIIFEGSAPKTQHPAEDILSQFVDEVGIKRYKYFPLPGNVAFGGGQVEKSQPQVPKNEDQLQKLTDVFGRGASTENVQQLSVVEQFALKCRTTLTSNLSSMECVAHDCPVLVKKEFYSLFPDVKLNNDRPLTVITLSQKTINDMSGWSEGVESEREDKILNFVGTAQEICKNLRDAGFWADFIDPCSGRPYLGVFTNSTMFETDERYRHFGVTIDDLGCCKVISHKKFGTHAFVGAIFTSASSDSESLVKILGQNVVEQEGTAAASEERAGEQL